MNVVLAEPFFPAGQCQPARALAEAGATVLRGMLDAVGRTRHVYAP